MKKRLAKKTTLKMMADNQNSKHVIQFNGDKCQQELLLWRFYRVAVSTLVGEDQLQKQLNWRSWKKRLAKDHIENDGRQSKFKACHTI